MVKHVKIRHINILTLFLVLFFNIINSIQKTYDIERYIFYILPFAITLPICIFFKSYKIDAYLFLIASIMSILIGNWGNLSGAVFLCFSLYCFENKRLTMIVICLTIISVGLKFIFLRKDSLITESILYLIGYSYIFIIYYILIHPKNYFNIDEDSINKKIIQFLIEGNKNKEIANKINLSQNAITKRIEKMRSKYNCGNNEQLIFYFIKNEKIRLN